MKSKTKSDEIKNKFKSFFENRSEEQKLKHEEDMLMANYLSEIERLCKPLKRNELASKIGTSPSYLTQVFRGDKPLNFKTLAKIQKALNIRFSVKASYTNDIVDSALNLPDNLPIVYEFKFGSYADFITADKQTYVATLSSNETINN